MQIVLKVLVPSWVNYCNSIVHGSSLQKGWLSYIVCQSSSHCSFHQATLSLTVWTTWTNNSTCGKHQQSAHDLMGFYTLVIVEDHWKIVKAKLKRIDKHVNNCLGTHIKNKVYYKGISIRGWSGRNLWNNFRTNDGYSVIFLY